MNFLRISTREKTRSFRRTCQAVYFPVRSISHFVRNSYFFRTATAIQPSLWTLLARILLRIPSLRRTPRVASAAVTLVAFAARYDPFQIIRC